MNVGRLVALVALTLAATRAASPQGTPALVIRVLERTTQQPLPNAEDSERLAGGPTGRLRLRQLGFQFVEQDVANRSQNGRSSAAYRVLELLAAGRHSRCHPEEPGARRKAGR